MNLINSVGYEDDSLKEQAADLSRRLDLILDKDAVTCLYLTSERLTLKLEKFLLMYPDFRLKTWTKRKSEGKKQGLVKACVPCPGLKIIDATAGWGKDAAILASFGAEVLMIERHQVMATLLKDALQNRDNLEQQHLNLSLHEGDAISFLQQLSPSDYPDVIYIDPMHPERSKTALVKKEMQALQQMIGPDKDVFPLLSIAQSRVKQRVVVKWPQKVKPIVPADACIEGKTVRFDLYFPR